MAVSLILNRMEVVIVEQYDKSRTVVVDIVQQTMESAVQDTISDVRKAVENIQGQEEQLRATVGKQIFKSLYFPMILDRQEAIPEAHGKTLDWIF